MREEGGLVPRPEMGVVEDGAGRGRPHGGFIVGYRVVRFWVGLGGEKVVGVWVLGRGRVLLVLVIWILLEGPGAARLDGGRVFRVCWIIRGGPGLGLGAVHRGRCLSPSVTSLARLGSRGKPGLLRPAQRRSGCTAQRHKARLSSGSTSLAPR